MKDRKVPVMILDMICLILTTMGLTSLLTSINGSFDANVIIVSGFFFGIKLLIMGIGVLTGIARRPVLGVIFIIIANGIAMFVNLIMVFGISNKTMLMVGAADVILVFLVHLLVKDVPVEWDAQKEGTKRSPGKQKKNSKRKHVKQDWLRPGNEDVDDITDIYSSMHETGTLPKLDEHYALESISDTGSLPTDLLFEAGSYVEDTPPVDVASSMDDLNEIAKKNDTESDRFAEAIQVDAKDQESEQFADEKGSLNLNVDALESEEKTPLDLDLYHEPAVAFGDVTDLNQDEGSWSASEDEIERTPDPIEETFDNDPQISVFDLFNEADDQTERYGMDQADALDIAPVASVDALEDGFIDDGSMDEPSGEEKAAISELTAMAKEVNARIDELVDKEKALKKREEMIIKREQDLAANMKIRSGEVVVEINGEEVIIDETQLPLFSAYLEQQKQ